MCSLAKPGERLSECIGDVAARQPGQDRSGEDLREPIPERGARQARRDAGLLARDHTASPPHRHQSLVPKTAIGARDGVPVDAEVAGELADRGQFRAGCEMPLRERLTQRDDDLFLERLWVVEVDAYVHDTTVSYTDTVCQARRILTMDRRYDGRWRDLQDFGGWKTATTVLAAYLRPDEAAHREVLGDAGAKVLQVVEGQAKCCGTAKCHNGRKSNVPRDHIRSCGTSGWAWVELNYRPHAYQACALTT